MLKHSAQRPREPPLLRVAVFPPVGWLPRGDPRIAIVGRREPRSLVVRRDGLGRGGPRRPLVHRGSAERAARVCALGFVENLTARTPTTCVPRPRHWRVSCMGRDSARGLASGEREGDRLLEAHLGACPVHVAPVPRAVVGGCVCEEVLFELRIYVGIPDRADRGRCTEQPCGALWIAPMSGDRPSRQGPQRRDGSQRARDTAEAAHRPRQCSRSTNGGDRTGSDPRGRPPIGGRSSTSFGATSRSSPRPATQSSARRTGMAVGRPSGVPVDIRQFDVYAFRAKAR